MNLLLEADLIFLIIVYNPENETPSWELSKAVVITLIVWEQHPRPHHKGAAMRVNATGSKVGFKLVTDYIQFYVFANLARNGFQKIVLCTCATGYFLGFGKFKKSMP